MREYEAITVASLSEALTVIATFDVSNIERIYVEIAVTDQALDQFEIHCRAHNQGSYQQMFNAAVDYTSPIGILVGVSGDLTIIAAGASGWFMLDVRSIESLQIKAASGNVAGSGVTVYAGAN